MFGGGHTPTDPYGESKCLLNDRFREVVPEWTAQGITGIVLHPGVTPHVDVRPPA